MGPITSTQQCPPHSPDPLFSPLSQFHLFPQWDEELQCFPCHSEIRIRKGPAEIDIVMVWLCRSLLNKFPFTGH